MHGSDCPGKQRPMITSRLWTNRSRDPSWQKRVVRQHNPLWNNHLPDVVNIRKPQEDVAASSNQKFEFVTLTSEPSTITTRETSKTVRKQAMNDYLRKQNRQATTGIPQVVESVHLDEPSRYKGKFKLNTWTHKTKTKAILARRVKSLEEQDAISDLEDLLLPTGSSSTLTIVSPWSLISSDRPPLRIFSPSTASLDPFNTSAIRLGPNSEKLLVHCTPSLLWENQS